jgi:sec-independent protein translocase protein TatB
MLGVGWPELLVVAVVTVLVVGPKELPRVLRTFTMFVRKAQSLAREFTSGMEDLARQADLDDLKKETAQLESISQKQFDGLDQSLDPNNTVAGMFTGTAIGGPPPGTQPIGTPTAGSNQVTGGGTGPMVTAANSTPAPAAITRNVKALEKPIAPAPAAEPRIAPAAEPRVAVAAEPRISGIQPAAESIPLEKRRAGA